MPRMLHLSSSTASGSGPAKMSQYAQYYSATKSTLRNSWTLL